VEEKEFIQAIEKRLGKGNWLISEVTIGNTSPNRYRLINGDCDFFAKEIKNNERDILKVIRNLGLKHIEEIICPDLLEDNILITQFVEAGHIKNMDIGSGLIEDLAKIQNYYFEKDFQKEPTDVERTGWGNFLEGHYTRSSAKLEELKDTYPDIIPGYKNIFDKLEQHFDNIKASYIQMPFRHLHNDFREENILASSPPKIIDWGSSYGFGPMLYDIAPFILYKPQLLDNYRRIIAGFEDNSDKEFLKWTYICGVARFYAFLTYIKEFSQSDGIEKALKQKYPVWEKLLDKDYLN